jgi:uncharacterized short protein YbdD (DUF466 family)
MSGTPMITSANETPHAEGQTAPQSFAARVLALVRTIIGVPDYDRYRRHMAVCHPDQRLLSESEFAEERLAAKYSRPGQRCC